ncbi:MAG: hypothetical protein KAT66_00010 [Candidatus Lokiarchaeota archaeon]|nr:hypothetical protein [Candidatus Lokiarchaeota archaeon]
MTRYYILILKIIGALVLSWMLTIFVISIFHFDQVVYNDDGDFVFFAVIGSLVDVFTYLFYAVAFLIAIFCAFVTAGPNSYLFDFISTFFQNYLGLWFRFPGGISPDIDEIPDLIGDEIAGLLNNVYLFSFQILFAIAIIYAIRSFFKSDPKYTLYTIGSIVLMIVIPFMVFEFNDMMALLGMETLPFFENLADPIDDILTDLPIDDFAAFMASPVTVFGIIAYIYLELSFQANYAETVTKPSLQRSDRLEAQLNILKRESIHITANVDKIREEAKKRREEIETGQKEGISVGKFFARTSKRFSFVKEMIERRKLEEEEKKLVTAASKTRRLGRYIDRLFKEDPEAQNTLTASSSAPRVGNLAYSTVINFSYRVILLIFISYIIIHPRWFLLNVFNLPPAITESVAMYSPESIIILLLPIMLLFPVISQIISYIKHRNLIIRLQQEGRIKEILASVGDYVKKEEVEEEGIVEETV